VTSTSIRGPHPCNASSSSAARVPVPRSFRPCWRGGDLKWRWGDRDARPQRRRLRQRLGFAQKRAYKSLDKLQRRLSCEARRPPWPLRTEGCARRFVDLLDASAHAEGRTAWVEKTPYHLLYIPEIERHVPDARFVHVIRPGEDVLASIADANLRYENNNNAFGGGTVHWSRRWNRAAQIHRAYARQPHHHFVFLDDLTRDNRREWHRLCAFLQIDAAAELDASCDQPIADLDNEPWKRDALSGQPAETRRKAESMFGPQVREWLRRQLTPYEELRCSCKGGELHDERNKVRYLSR
jgi:hypothetical protein